MASKEDDCWKWLRKKRQLSLRFTLALQMVVISRDRCMPEVVEIPIELTRFQLPEAVQKRLQLLLDRQDAGEELTQAERQEAEGLVELVEFLSLLRLRS